jgi:hypothetical protein
LFWNLQHFIFRISDFTSQNLKMAKNLTSTYTKDFFLMGKNAKQGGFATIFGGSWN